MNVIINAVAKRYRNTGKERAEESGLYYHGARYYIPWLGRWSAADPLENDYPGITPYNYGFNNPVTFYDPTGMNPEYPIHTVAEGENLTQIAKNYGVDVKDLIEHNNISDPNVIMPGQQINIPIVDLETVIFTEHRLNFDLNAMNNAYPETRDGALKYYGDKLNLHFILNRLGKTSTSSNDIKSLGMGLLTYASEEISDNFVIKQQVFNQNPFPFSKGSYGTRPVTYGQPFVVDKSDPLQGNYITDNRIQKVNTGIQRTGYVFNIYNISKSWIDVLENQALAQSNSSYQNAYEDVRNDAITNTAKTILPYVVRRSSPYILTYDGLNLLLSFFVFAPFSELLPHKSYTWYWRLRILQFFWNKHR